MCEGISTRTTSNDQLRGVPPNRASALTAVTLPQRTRKSHLRRLSEPASVKPGAAQILKGISLVTFFVPAKKVTRWPQDSGSFGLSRKLPLPEGQRNTWPELAARQRKKRSV